MMTTTTATAATASVTTGSTAATEAASTAVSALCFAAMKINVSSASASQDGGRGRHVIANEFGGKL